MSKTLSDVTSPAARDRIHCVVYRGKRRPDSYLFVEHRDNFERVPDTLLSLLGKLEFVMALELEPGRRLAQADVVEVMSQLQQRGYYLQMEKQDVDPLM